MKCILVFAGPNGAGKSTVIRKASTMESFPDLYICPDEIAKEYIYIQDEIERNVKAMQIAEELRNIAVENGETFAFETVLSTTNKLDFLKVAKEKGYLIEAIFVTTKSPNINIERIKKRVEQGGHDVPQDKTVARYERCMTLLPKLVKIVDGIKVYDNSYDTETIVFIKKLNNEMRLLNKEKREPWVKKCLIDPLIRDGYISEHIKYLSVDETKEYLKKPDKNDELLDFQ